MKDLDKNELLEFIQAIAAMPIHAVKELGYTPSNDDRKAEVECAIAISMLFLSSMNGLSEGSLDVPNLTGLSYLDQTQGALYHGPQVILVSLCMLANSLITLQQLYLSRCDTDSHKLHTERTKELERLQVILDQYVEQKKTSEDQDITEIFEESYIKALHVQVRKNVLSYRDQWLVGEEALIGELVYDLPDFTKDNLRRTKQYLEGLHEGVKKEYSELKTILESLHQFCNDSTHNITEPLTSFVNEIMEEEGFKKTLLCGLLDQNKAVNDQQQFVDKKDKERLINELIYFWLLSKNHPEIRAQDWARELEFNPENNQYIGQALDYQAMKQTGYAIGYFNVLVNIGIGIGAFYGFCGIMYALTGFSILALLGVGWPLIVVVAFFALLSALMPYLITRIYINEFFEGVAYNFKIWLQSENKVYDLIKALSIRKNLITLLVTLPTSIGLTIIAAVAFYVATPIMPIALIIGAVTFIACVSLFGGMFYNSYDRLENMIMNANYERLALPAAMATCIMVALIVALYLNPFTAPFMALAPISAILLMLVISTIVLTLTFAYSGKWSMGRSVLGALGLTAALGQSIAIFCCAAILFSTPVGIVLALFSFPLFFSWAVMTVALPEDEMVRHSASKSSSHALSSSEFGYTSLNDDEQDIILDTTMNPMHEGIFSSEDDQQSVDGPLHKINHT